jgi:hypothetical protein
VEALCGESVHPDGEPDAVICGTATASDVKPAAIPGGWVSGAAVRVELRAAA